MSGIVKHLVHGRQGRVTVLVLSGAEVRALLDLDELVEALRAAMIDLSAGRVSAPELWLGRSSLTASRDWSWLWPTSPQRNGAGAANEPLAGGLHGGEGT